MQARKEEVVLDKDTNSKYSSLQWLPFALINHIECIAGIEIESLSFIWKMDEEVFNEQQFLAVGCVSSPPQTDYGGGPSDKGPRWGWGTQYFLFLF